MAELPAGVDINNLIDDIKSFCWEASEILMYYSQIIKDSNGKCNIICNDKIEDPVTLADIKVNDLIIKRISEKYKNVGWEILSEENVKNNSSDFESNCDWVWVFDPLDGTKDFLQGTGDYAMHLGLNYKQRSFIGFVLLPEKNQLWFTDGEKIFGERRDGSRISPCLNNKKSLGEMLIVKSKNHSNIILETLIEKIKFKDIITMGSIGCKISSILRGESDVYISLSLKGMSSPKDWDFAAPEAILKAAGGAITKLNYAPLIYQNCNFEQSGIIIASSNKKDHEFICNSIVSVIKKYDICQINI